MSSKIETGILICLFLLIGSACAKPSTPTTTTNPTATPIPTKTEPPTVQCQDTVDEMEALTQELNIPDHLRQEDPERTREEFDVNAYFRVLTHLSLEPGYVLDYVYRSDPMGSRPVIYARREGDTPFTTYAGLDKDMGDPLGKYLQHIRVDGTAQGFFEWVLLRTYGEQFYLSGHAISALDWNVVCNQEAAEAVMEAANDFGKPFTAEQERKALQLEFEPRVNYQEDIMKVRVIVFSKWGGFFEHVETISREFPHHLLEYEHEELVPYNCGVMP